MTHDGPVRWLVVGTSDIVKKRGLPALLAAHRSKVVGIVGDAERARAIATPAGIEQVYGSLDRALADAGADALYIATPVFRHRPESLAAIKAGKHVLIEKPLGLSGDDAQAISDAAAAAGVVAGCAYYRRLLPRYALAAKMIREQELGRLTLIRIHVAGWFNPVETDPKIWRTRKAQAGGGNSMDMGCHMLDLLIHMCGMPRTVQARVGTLVQNYEVDDSTVALMTLPNATPVIADFHWNTHAGGHEFEIVGTRGRLRMSPADAGAVTLTLDGQTRTLDLPNPANIHQPLVDDFVHAVLASRQPAAPLDEAVRVNRLIDAVYRAGQTGEMVVI